MIYNCEFFHFELDEKYNIFSNKVVFLSYKRVLLYLSVVR